jgi:hypothetical protein
VGINATMLNGWSRLANNPSPSRRFAQLIDSKYGKVIDAPNLVE